MAETSIKHVAGVKVKIAGADLPKEIAEGTTEVRVSESLSLPATAVLRITDADLKVVDNAIFAPGKELQVLMSAAPETSAEPLFTGEIVTLEPEFTEQGAVMVVRAYDKSHRLQRKRQMRTWQDVSVRDVVSTITGAAGLSGTISFSGTTSFKFFQQSWETDREVLAKLERDYDCRFYMRDGRYKFVDAAEASGAPVRLKYTEGLLSFRPRMSTVQQEGSAEVGGWDAKTGRPINGSSSSATTTSTAGVQRGALLGDFRNEKLGIVDRFVDNQQEAAALAKSALNRRADAHFEAEARCQGTPGIRAGGKVQIEGVGTKFSGTYVVSSVTHLYRGKKGYQTSFTISGRSERGLLDLVHPPAKREWSRHLVVGIVTNVNDPDKLGRVRVKYPSLPAGSGGDLESSWAQMVTLGASNQRGALMLPEIDDEVIVGFENGDARRPLILGACFHGMKKPSPDLLQDNDGSFAMVSNKKSFMKTAEDMTFKSDKNLIIEISGDDKEKVDGQVELKAGSSYKVEAGTSVTLKGNSITVEAASSLKLKGATVDIESSGPASFKGAMVNVEASGPASLKGAMVNIG